MKITPPMSRLVWTQPASRAVWPTSLSRKSPQVWVRYWLGCRKDTRAHSFPLELRMLNAELLFIPHQASFSLHNMADEGAAFNVKLNLFFCGGALEIMR